MVRFGNVLDSSGSVVRRFRNQIKEGGPVTVTHPEIIRYFMSIPEAAQLVIQAGAMASGGEVFVLDMGTPVKIDDLARTMIRLSGLEVRDENNPEGDIAIEYVGLRRGEKLYEELLIGENTTGTSHPRIFKNSEPILAYEDLVAALERLDDAIQRHRQGRAAGDAARHGRRLCAGQHRATRSRQGRMAAGLAHAALRRCRCPLCSWAHRRGRRQRGARGVLILILRPMLVRHLLAHPNARSSHKAPTPQGAGSRVMLALLAGRARRRGCSWAPRAAAPTPLPGARCRRGRSPCSALLDDAHALPVSWRFIGQTLAALVMVREPAGGFAPLARSPAARASSGRCSCSAPSASSTPSTSSTGSTG